MDYTLYVIYCRNVFIADMYDIFPRIHVYVDV